SCSYFLFFYCYGDHRDLHSFPTRRSSDLPLVGLGQFLSGINGIIGQKMEFVGLEKMAGPRGELGKYCLFIAAVDTPLIPGDNILDRKSTRLNSSHVKISYAVFCLKKKNIS